jgi:hypothetical protein
MLCSTSRTSRLLAFLLALPALAAAKAPDVRFELAAAPLELVQDDGKFREFAQRVGVEVERLLGVPAAVDDPATFRLLLSTRVHLAHYFADNEKAVATAAWIRSVQSSPVERSFAGLTTLASVAARRGNPGAAPREPRYREAFRQEFTRQLAALPLTAETAGMLRGQREKIAAITEAALLAETRDVIAPALRRRGFCGLEEADQLVRVRHRLVSILPVREETLSALDAAIAARAGR